MPLSELYLSPLALRPPRKDARRGVSDGAALGGGGRGSGGPGGGSTARSGSALRIFCATASASAVRGAACPALNFSSSDTTVVVEGTKVAFRSGSAVGVLTRAAASASFACPCAASALSLWSSDSIVVVDGTKVAHARYVAAAGATDAPPPTSPEVESAKASLSGITLVVEAGASCVAAAAAGSGASGASTGGSRAESAAPEAETLFSISVFPASSSAWAWSFTRCFSSTIALRAASSFESPVAASRFFICLFCAASLACA